MINGKTEIYGLIGYPITHSLSPEIHNFLFRKFNINGVYLCYNSEFDRRDFKNFLTCLQKVKNFKGLNITIPYKEWACKLIDNEFKTLGAVNCLKFENGNITATNTDIYGFKKSVENYLNFNFKKKKVLIFGAGATAKSIIFSIIKEVDKIYIHNRTRKNAEKLKYFFNDNKKIEINYPDNLKEIDFIINSTPIGLKGEKHNIDFNKLRNDCCFFDVIYLDTPFIKEAKSKGFKAINGKPMLIYQAVKSFEYWTSLKVDEVTVNEILRNLL